jgi:mannose-6-phosphate isomerase-like protein (cupin superfamily)
MYYILEGIGIMTVDDEEKEVRKGDCVFFPSYSRHGLQNTGETVLKYLSAASPSFTIKQCNDLWPLQSLSRLDD